MSEWETLVFIVICAIYGPMLLVGTIIGIYICWDCVQEISKEAFDHWHDKRMQQINESLPPSELEILIKNTQDRLRRK